MCLVKCNYQLIQFDLIRGVQCCLKNGGLASSCHPVSIVGRKCGALMVLTRHRVGLKSENWDWHQSVWNTCDSSVWGTKSHTLGLQSALKLTLELIQEILNAKLPIGWRESWYNTSYFVFPSHSGYLGLLFLALKREFTTVGCLPSNWQTGFSTAESSPRWLRHSLPLIRRKKKLLAGGNRQTIAAARVGDRNLLATIPTERAGSNADGARLNIHVYLYLYIYK